MTMVILLANRTTYRSSIAKGKEFYFIVLNSILKKV